MAHPVLSPAPGAGAAAPTGTAARVRTLVRLRFLVLKNTLSRHPWQLVGAIFGGLYGLGILAAVVFGLVALSWAEPETRRSLLVIGGSALVLGWVLGPIVTSGMDRTLDPARLVSLPLAPRAQLLGIAAASLLGVAGLVTLLVALATALAWLGSPLAAVAAALLAPLAALTCVLACQLTTTALSRLAASRRYREIIAGVLLVLMVLLAPLIMAVGSGIAAAAEAPPALGAALSWTPLGAVWAVPAEIAAGNWGVAGLKLLIALAGAAALAAGWRALFRSQQGRPGAAGRTTARRGTGWFGRFPATPRGAIAARSLSYWLSDPRYQQNLLGALVFPLLFWFLSGVSEAPIMLTGSTIMVALLLSLSTFTDLSYDGTAFSLHLLRGVRGIDDRLGRIWACALVTVPLVLLVATATSWAVGRLDQLPTLLGLAAAVVLSGFGVASVSSAIFVMPVPESGENPFASKPGAGMLSLVGTFGSYGSVALLSLPTAALAVAAGVTGRPGFAWLTLAVGLLCGGLVFAIGVRWGARLFDRRGAELFARLTAQG